MARKVIGMARNVVGRKGSTRRRWGGLMTAVLAVSVAVALVIATHATTAFQLDGDATTATGGHVPVPPGGPGADDWDEICYEDAVDPNGDGNPSDGILPAAAQTLCGTNVPADGGISGAVVSTAWIAEPSPDSTTIFTEGSKDILDVTEWVYKNNGGLPDKDNLLHGFGARYSLPNDPDGAGEDSACPSGTFATCEVLYFGSDRFDDEGSATTGVWFFQKKVTLGPLKQGSGPFIGAHTIGDVLVTSEFTVGGTISTMKIFTWQPSCTGNGSASGPLEPGQSEADCAEKNLYLEASSTAANCASATAADAFCGLVNDDIITLPWGGTAAFQDKDKTGGAGSNQAAAGEFYEGGINLSQLGLGGECFQSVLLNSRSSAEPNSTIKDFVLGQLGECSAGLTTQASTNGAVAPGTPVTDRAIVQISGASAPEDPIGTVTFSICGPNASAPPVCTTGAGGNSTQIGSAVTLTNADCSPVSPTADGKTCAVSLSVNDSGQSGIRGNLAPGYYCFVAKADLTNYDDPAEFTNTTTECFRVRDTSLITTAQRWLPNDQATVTLSNGVTPASGTVRFSLYENSTCSGTPVAVFPPANQPGFTLDNNGQALTNNVNNYVATTSISWRVVFTPADSNLVEGKTSHCEQSSVSINNAGVP